MNPKTEKLAQLMGWHRRETGWWSYIANGVHNFGAPLTWNPWESIADAWMIVEEMERRGYFWQIIRGYTFSSPGDLSPKTKCSFWSGTDPYQCGTYAATSIKEAICEAALRLEEQDELQA